MASEVPALPILAWLALVRLTAGAAEPPPDLPLELEWHAPAGCPDGPAVTAMVHALLRRWTPPTAPDRLVARADVTQGGRGPWELRLVLRSPQGHLQRTLRAETCPVLARAVALVLGVHLDPLAVRRGLDAPAEPPPPPALPDPPASAAVELTPAVAPPDVAPPDIPEPPAAPGPPAPPRVGAPVDLFAETDEAPPPAPPAGPPPPARAGHLRLDGGLDYGLLPGLGGNGGVFGGVTLPRLRVEVGLLGVPLRIRRTPEGGVRLDRLAAVVRVCPVWRVPRDRDVAAIFLCAAVEAGALHGTGLDVTRPNPRWVPWAAVSLGPALRWAIAGPLGLWLGAEGVLALTRPGFTLGPAQETLFQVGPAGLRVNFGVDLQFSARKR